MNFNGKSSERHEYILTFRPRRTLRFAFHRADHRTERPQPLSGNQMPRCGGITTMMRLPHVQSAEGLDACFVGVPFDLGTSNRTGARFGPRQVRSESVLLRPYNMATRAAPFDSLRVADIGDVAINPYNLLDSIDRIERAYAKS